MFDFAALFVELQREIVARADRPTAFMLSLTSKEMHRRFRQGITLFDRVPRKRKGTFLNDLFPVETILHRDQRTLIDEVILANYGSVFDYLMDICQWIPRMEDLQLIVLEMIKNKAILHFRLIRMEGGKDSLRCSCRGTVCDLWPKDVTFAMGVAGIREIVQYFHQYHEILMPALQENHVEFLKGLLVHDSIEVFQCCTAPEQWKNDLVADLLGAFVQYNAVKCFAHYVQAHDEIPVSPVIKAIIQKKKPWKEMISICDILVEKYPDIFNAVSSVILDLVDSEDSRPLATYLLGKTISPQPPPDFFPRFLEILQTYPDAISYHFPRGWYEIASPYLPEEYRREYENKTRT